jgi:hypothetical protein
MEASLDLHVHCVGRNWHLPAMHLAPFPLYALHVDIQSIHTKPQLS